MGMQYGMSAENCQYVFHHVECLRMSAENCPNVFGGSTCERALLGYHFGKYSIQMGENCTLINKHG